MFVTHAESQLCPTLTTPWTVAHQALLSLEFPRQEHRNRLPFPPPGHLPNPGIKPASLVPPALAGEFFTTVPPGKPHIPISDFIKKV